MLILLIQLSSSDNHLYLFKPDMESIPTTCNGEGRGGELGEGRGGEGRGGEGRGGEGRGGEERGGEGRGGMTVIHIVIGMFTIAIP